MKTENKSYIKRDCPNRVKVIIPAIPPSNNESIGRDNRWNYQTAKKEWATLIWGHVVSKRPDKPFEKSEVKITYYFGTKHRRDPDNYSGKFILDGLKGSGIIVDDSFDHIALQLFGKYDKENPRTEIEVIEVLR